MYSPNVDNGKSSFSSSMPVYTSHGRISTLFLSVDRVLCRGFKMGASITIGNTAI